MGVSWVRATGIVNADVTTLHVTLRVFAVIIERIWLVVIWYTHASISGGFVNH